MTTQDAGRPTGEGSPGHAASGEAKAIDFDEAERLASMIRPAWELGLTPGDLEPHPEAAAPVEAQTSPSPAASAPAASPAPGGAKPGPSKPGEPSRPSLSASEGRLAEGGIDPSTTSGASISLIPRDTVIDGVPTVGVGERTSVDSAGSVASAGSVDSALEGSPSKGAFAAAIAEGIAIVDRGAADAPREPPRRAGPTKLGLGDGVAAAVREEGEKETTTAMPVSASLREAASAGDEAASSEPAAPQPSSKKSGLKAGGTIRMDASLVAAATRSTPPPERAALEPMAPVGASLSKADDPIELPVQKGGKTIAMVLGGVAAVGAIIAGVTIFGSSSAPEASDKAKDTKPTSQATSTTSPAAATATAKQTATATATAAAQTASATATASATESASAAASSAPAPSASASAPPPKTSEPAKPPPPSTATTSKPPPKSTGTAKPPPPPGGGIIRDTPF